MFRVSKFVRITAVILLATLVAGIVLSLAPSAAGAASTSPSVKRAAPDLALFNPAIAKTDLSQVPMSQQASIPARQVNAPASPAAVNRPQASSVCSSIGDWVPLIGGAVESICNAADAIVSATGKALDCVTDIPACITGWIYDTVMGGVTWVANGILTLVVGVHKECLPADASNATRTSESFNATACESRIMMDYFPSQYSSGTNKADQILNNNYGLARAVAAQAADTKKYLKGLSATPDQKDAIDEMVDQLNTAQSQLGAISGNSTVHGKTYKVSRNDVFYTPKSTVSTAAFNREYGKYVLIGFLILVPMVIAGAVQSVITGKPQLMLRSVFLHLPLAMLMMVISPYLVRLFMSITDSFSAFILKDSTTDINNFLLGLNPYTRINGATDFVPTVTMLMSLIVVAAIFIVSAMLVWFILNMREASVSLIAVFLPIAYAASVWPALSKWTIRVFKLLMAAIISKIFIVGSLSLGIATFGGSTQTVDGVPSYSQLFYGATIFIIAAFAPSLIMRFFDEIGEALHAAGSTGFMNRGFSVGANANGAVQLLGLKGGSGGGGGMGGGLSSALGGIEGMRALQGGGSPTDAMRTARQATKAAGGNAAEQGAAAGNVFSAATGERGSNLHQAVGQDAADDVMAHTGNAQEAGIAGGVASMGAGASPQEAGQIAHENVLRHGGSQQEASAARSEAVSIGRQQAKEHAKATGTNLSKIKLAAATVAGGPIGTAAYLAHHRRRTRN
jgi:hypothetical protein